MTIRICDVCGQTSPGVMSTYQVGDRVFDVGGCCEDKPFIVPPVRTATMVKIDATSNVVLTG